MTMKTQKLWKSPELPSPAFSLGGHEEFVCIGVIDHANHRFTTSDDHQTGRWLRENRQPNGNLLRHMMNPSWFEVILFCCCCDRWPTNTTSTGLVPTPLKTRAVNKSSNDPGPKASTHTKAQAHLAWAKRQGNSMVQAWFNSSRGFVLEKEIHTVPALFCRVLEVCKYSIIVWQQANKHWRCPSKDMQLKQTKNLANVQCKRQLSLTYTRSPSGCQLKKKKHTQVWCLHSLVKSRNLAEIYVLFLAFSCHDDIKQAIIFKHVLDLTKQKIYKENPALCFLDYKRSHLFPFLTPFSQNQPLNGLCGAGGHNSTGCHKQSS